jgi:hypothetical protein
VNQKCPECGSLLTQEDIGWHCPDCGRWYLQRDKNRVVGAAAKRPYPNVLARQPDPATYYRNSFLSEQRKQALFRVLKFIARWTWRIGLITLGVIAVIMLLAIIFLGSAAVRFFISTLPRALSGPRRGN